MASPRIQLHIPDLDDKILENNDVINTEDISKRTIRLGIYNNDSYRTVTKHLHDEEAGTKLASEDIYNSAGGQYEGDEIP